MKLSWTCFLLPLALAACEASCSDDPFDVDLGVGGGGGGGGAPPTCELELTMTGEVDGSPMPTPGDVVDSVWFNSSLDEELLDAIDEEIMTELGLDPDDQADVERYRYLIKEADYRFLARQEAPPDDDGVIVNTKDITVFYFDLAGHPADLDHPITVFDLTAVEEARDSGSREALGDALRVAADTIRDNGHPDVVVAYAADRSDEGWGNVLVSLLSRNARLASGGRAWIHGAQPEEGEPIATISLPLPDITSIGVRVEPVFSDPADTMRIDATCLPVIMSN